jgi:glycogen(starch) synthase
VLASTYSPSEVVIINDGSTDPKSLEVLRAIEERAWPQARILHTENQGLALTRNYGAEHARGEFIAFVDADDMVEPDFFKRSIDVLQRYPNVNFVSSWIRMFDGRTNVWPIWNTEFPYLLGHNMFPALTIVRRSSFLQSGNKKEFEYNFEDYEGWLSLMEAGGLGISLPFPLVRYRARHDSMFKNCGRNQYLYLYDLLTQHHPQLYRDWGVELFNLQCANGAVHTWGQPAQESCCSEAYNQLEIAQKQLLSITSTLRWRICERVIHSYPGRLAKFVYLKLKNRLCA